MFDPVGAAIRGQELAAASMQDSCVVRRRKGQTTDRVTGEVVEAWETVYEGPCKGQNNKVYPTLPESAGHQFTVGIATLFLPVNMQARAVRSGDVATITESVNPVFVGAILTLRVDDSKSFQTALRFNTSEVVA